MISEKEVFFKAVSELTTEQFKSWLCFAYGILEKGMTNKQKKLLLKAIEQDKKVGKPV